MTNSPTAIVLVAVAFILTGLVKDITPLGLLTIAIAIAIAIALLSLIMAPVEAAA